MIPEYLLNYPWIPAIAWIILYTSDYYLTLWGARLSRSQSIMRREGSYELTPGYVSDINEQRKFSPTFLFWLLIGTLVLLFFAPSARESPNFYGLLVGYFLFLELAIHIRHFSNICYYRSLSKAADVGIEGHLNYTRTFTYKQSSSQLFALGVFMFLAYGLTLSCLILGGGISITRTAYSHWKLAARYNKTGDK